MARSDPSRSHYCATRHLLRHLRDARQLRRNPLTRAAFAAARLVEDALRIVNDRTWKALNAIESGQESSQGRHGGRWLAILLRVDVERHVPSDVAAGLGLSIRQFHRERRFAHEAFLSAYRAAVPHRSRIAVSDDLTSHLLDRAAGLADSGETSSASAILDDVARSGTDASIRCNALIRLAELETWTHRFDRARSYLQASDALLAEASLSMDTRIGLQDARNAATLRLGWFAQGPAVVNHGAGKTGLSPIVDGRGTCGERTAFLQAAAALRNGEAADAARLLKAIGGRGAPARTPELEVDILTLQAELAEFIAEDPLRSEELFSCAAATARAHGLRGRELYATHQLFLTRWMHSRDVRDRTAYRGLVDRTDHALPPRLRSYLLFSAADVELAIGHPRRALDAARASARVCTNSYESLSARGLAAGSLFRLGRVAEAAVEASLTADAARAHRQPRVVSLAQRISAQAYLAQGNRVAARAAIEEAIECARYFSSQHVLAQAQSVLARITGRPAGMAFRR